MELALPLPFEGGFLIPRLGKLLGTVGRWFKSETLGEEDIAYLADIVRGATAVGPPVLGAKDVGDFADQMDRTTRRPQFYELIEPIFWEVPSRTRVASSAFDTGQSAADRAALFVEALGPGAIRPLLRGFQYQLAIRRALEPLSRLVVGAIVDAQPRLGESEFFRKSKEQPLWFLTDTSMSVEVARGWYHLMDTIACLLVMAWVFMGSPRPESWLSLALAERWESDLYSILRLVASVPDCDVPEDLVPVSDRYDLQRAEANAGRARLQAHRLFAEAERRGTSIWPPLDEAEDG